jgi:hypothetical protein
MGIPKVQRTAFAAMAFGRTKLSLSVVRFCELALDPHRSWGRDHYIFEI